jgi:hypothetical protein
MRLALLAGLASLFVAQAAKAQEPEPEERPIELGLPPPPPPGAETALEPDGPVPEAEAKPAGIDSPIAPTRTPSFEPAVQADPSRDDLEIGVPKPKAPARWYGWQIFIGDAGAGVLALLPPPAGMVYGGGTYLLTAPAIHLGHKRGLAALGSFALRFAVPFATTNLVDGDVRCVDACLKPGMVVSAIVVSIIDGVWIAREAEPSPPKHTVSIAPGVSVTREGATLSMGGAF